MLLQWQGCVRQQVNSQWIVILAVMTSQLKSTCQENPTETAKPQTLKFIVYINVYNNYI